MGKLAVQKYFSFMMLIITMMMMIFTITGLYGGEANPSGNMARALLVYVLPLLIAGNVILLVYWLILKRWHWALMPFITLLCCIPYTGTLYQFRSIDEIAEKQAGLKIATYNVAGFGHEASGFIAQDVLAEMKKQKVDVFCIQEYSNYSGDKNNAETYKEYFPYVAYGANGHMATFSRYPIKASEPIEFPASANAAMCIDIDVDGQMTCNGDPITVDDLTMRVEEFVANRNDDPLLPEKSLREVHLMGRCRVSDRHVITIETHSNTTYEAYFDMQNAIVRGYNNLRNELAQQRFRHSYAQCSPEERASIALVYPQRISEKQPVTDAETAQRATGQEGGSQ